MPITASSPKFYRCSTPPVDATTASVGGGVSVTEITGVGLYEVHYRMASSPTIALYQYSKLWFKNSHATENAVNSGIWLGNSMIAMPATKKLKFSSSSALDDDSFMVRILGNSAITEPLQEEVALNGLTAVSTISGFEDAWIIEIRSVASTLLTVLTGDLTVTDEDDVYIGTIPAGIKNCQGLIDVGIEAANGGTTTIATAAVAPGGIAFTRPANMSAMLAIGNVNALAARAIWSRLTVPIGCKPSTDWQTSHKGVMESA